MTQAILLFAHGSRDATWRSPFEAILDEVKARHDGPVSLAFLEYMTPDFATAVTALVGQGASHIRLVPLFLAAGGHVRSCLPALVNQAQADPPGLQLSVLPPLGDSATLVRAFADFAVQPLSSQV